MPGAEEEADLQNAVLLNTVDTLILFVYYVYAITKAMETSETALHAYYTHVPTVAPCYSTSALHICSDKHSHYCLPTVRF